MATRLITISDLHLGGTPPYMMSQPQRLAAFIHGLPADCASNESLELVIAGDFVDFLAIERQESRTADQDRACAKLRSVMNEPPFATVFDALAAHIENGHDLTVLLGNHDVELVMPGVQADLLARMGATPRRVRFIDDGRAYWVGGALIEHGNRYDGANVNDWTGLRAIASALSRNEAIPGELFVSAGSEIVEQFINPLKSRYPFIDLLQPQGELTALLLLSFEPDIAFDLDNLSLVLKGRKREAENPRGLQPARQRNIGFEEMGTVDAELEEVFGGSYMRLRGSAATRPIGVLEWIRIWMDAQHDSLSSICGRGDSIGAKRLKEIRTVMKRLLVDDNSASLQGPAEQYLEAAKRLARPDAEPRAEVVVMGHTHLARQINLEANARYINTGTWADVVRVPDDVLEEGADDALQAFLCRLSNDDGVRSFVPSYADLRINRGGKVEQAILCWAT